MTDSSKKSNGQVSIPATQATRRRRIFGRESIGDYDILTVPTGKGHIGMAIHGLMPRGTSGKVQATDIHVSYDEANAAALALIAA